jgi:hypothetical protein
MDRRAVASGVRMRDPAAGRWRELRFIQALCTSLVICIPSICHADPASGARALFGDDTTSFTTTGEKSKTAKPRPAPRIQAATPHPGLSYWIELERSDGSVQRVATSREFSSGERIRLVVSTNQKGYLQVYNLGTSGRAALMFPIRAQEAGQMEPGRPYSVPVTSFLRFDSTPGEESLLLIYGTSPPANMPTPAGAGISNSSLQAYADAGGSRDLIREDAAQGGAFNASYVVAPPTDIQSGKVIAVTIKLRHR